MPKFEPLMMRAVREAGEKLNHLIQVILLESYSLAKDVSLRDHARRRATKIEEAARAAATVSRTFFGFSDDGEGPEPRENPEPTDSQA